MENQALPFPHVCLTVSGGHTLLVEVREGWKYEILGTTQDDAAGEAYDKVAQYLGLGFPGGKVIDDLAKKGNSNAIQFPRPMLDRDNYQFSFSGIKTAVRFFVQKAKDAGTLPPIVDIAASFQAAVVDVLVGKTIRAAKAKNVMAITLTGGVAANRQLRESMREAGSEIGADVYYPPIQLCTDNGAMIAGVACRKYQEGLRDALDLNAFASGPIVNK
jgi:N6-L-threonylcarbamoyladenine synthase